MHEGAFDKTLFFLNYLSASPITGSIEPIIATISEIIEPSDIYFKPCKLDDEGERIFNFHG